MPGQFINTGNTPGGNLKLTNTNNLGNFVFNTGGAPVGNITPYAIFPSYTPAISPGWITIPDHTNSQGLLNPELVGTTSSIGLYFNTVAGDSTDYTSELLGLVGNHTHLTLSWPGGNYVTYDCLSTAFEYDGGSGILNLYYDPQYGAAPFGSVNVIASSGTGASYTNQTITISYVII